MKNVFLNVRTAKAQAGCAKLKDTSLSFRRGLGRGFLFTFLLLTLGVGQMGANTYYITGVNTNLNGWGNWYSMTVSSDGYYEYFLVGHGDVNCKINTKQGWGGDFGEGNITYNFNGTDLGSGNSWSNAGNINFWYHNADYYIICYYPSTTINSNSSPVVCASTTLPDDTPAGPSVSLGASPTSAMCGEDITFTATPADLGGASATYTFTDITGGESTVIRASGASASCTHSWATTGTKRVQVTMSVGGNDYTATTNVTVVSYVYFYAAIPNSWDDRTTTVKLGSTDASALTPYDNTSLASATKNASSPCVPVYSAVSSTEYYQSGKKYNVYIYRVSDTNVGQNVYLGHTSWTFRTAIGTVAAGQLYTLTSGDNGGTYMTANAISVNSVTATGPYTIDAVTLTSSISAYGTSKDNLRTAGGDTFTTTYTLNDQTASTSTVITPSVSNTYTSNTGNLAGSISIDASDLIAGHTYTLTVTIADNITGKMTSSATSSSFAVTAASGHTISYTTQATGWTYGTKPTVADVGETVTFVVTPTTGYTVTVSSNDVSLSGPNASNEYTFTMPNADVSINVSAKENTYTVTLVNATAGSVTAGCATNPTITAAAAPFGMTFDHWDVTGGASVGNENNSITTVSATASGTVTAVYSEMSAYVQGRFGVYNKARSTTTYTFSSGDWNQNSKRIPMEYDATNRRFILHTYKKPTELDDKYSNLDPFFYFKVTTDKNDVETTAKVTSYKCNSDQTLGAADYANRKELYNHAGTSDTNNDKLKFSSTVSSGYAVLYFDGSYVWYELEQRLQYDANGGSGTAPTGDNGHNSYHAKDANATAEANTFTARKNYTFAGWNTAADITGTSYAAGASVPMSADRILYAKWNRSVTLDQQDATTPGSTSVTATWNCSTLPSITNPQKLGYEFGGWYTETAGNGNIIINTSGQLQANKTNWTVSGGKFQRTPSSDASESKPLYAKWTQTVTLNANTANHGSGANTTATIVYKATAKTSITHCTPATGYHLVGYYTAATDGVKVLNDDGSFAGSNVTDYITDGKWTKAGATTLYAHYEANTYTIAFDPNDANYVGEATGTTASIDATYGVSYLLTANGFTREGYTFAGWATTPTGAVAYTNGQSVNNLTDENEGTVTLYAKWTGTTYTVTFNARGGSDLSINSKPVTMGSAYGELATVTPPAGYVFDGWYTSAGGGTKVTSATQVTTAVDHTLYARYIQKAQVYFKNTIGWSQVWVTYDANWDGTQGTGNQGKTYHQMKLVSGTTDIYYDDIPDEYITSWRWNIAFNNLDYSSTPFYAFDNGEAVFRYDFDKNATMFVPTSNTGTSADGNYTKNGVQYRSTGYSEESSGPKYTSGYWRTYNNTYSGYTMTYQKKGGSWSGGHKMESAKVGDNVFCFTVNMEANSQYNFSFYKNYNLNNKSKQFCYNPSTQINSSNCTNLQLDCNPNNSYMQTTVAGEYTFQLEMKADGHMYLSVIYPLAVGDFRVRYNYTKGSAKTYYSEIIKGRANGKDTISIFIHSKDSASSRSLTVEKCTGISSGTPTWNTSYLTVTSKLPAATTAGGKTSGVYDFIITQNGSKEIILDNFSYWKQYTGNYYIRTQCADGGWDFYRERSDNLMTLSEYSLTQTLSAPYSHYYCRFISDSEISTTDISYAVATDYSPNISGTMVGDATIGGDAVKVLPASANVRFSWNEETNAMRRAYLKNAQTENARFLVLHGSDSKVLSATGSTISAKDDLQDNELKFTDMGNWIYQVNLQAQPGAEVSLIANYNGADRYLIGGATSFLTIIDGEGSAKYEMIAVYDFKTNRLMIAWTPSGEVGQNLTDVDVLLVRYKQNAGTVITLGTGKSVTSKTVIGAIRFDYNDLVGHVADWNSNSRPLLKYFISFPFDVNVSDIFGLNSAYGDAYEIQMYDGAERARKGFFRGDGTTTFWKTLQPGDVMKANEGYCVIMDNDYLNNDVGHVWDNKGSGSTVYLYFPSAGNVGSIASTSQTISIPSRPCTIDRTFTTHQGSTREVNHINTDSHWNMMGVPIFDTHSDPGTSGQPGAVFATSGTDGDGNFNYFYEWNPSNNQYSIHTAVNYSFMCMHGYMVQYHGNVTFKTAAAPASVAARRAPQKENYQIELQVLNNNADVLNSAFVELRENACDTFELNEDVYMSFNNLAVNIYTLAGNYDVAANVLSVGNHTIPVCVEVTKAGTYTFSMPSNFSGTATLVDSFTGERTNLALDDYEVNLQKGVIEDRFLLEIDVQKVATAIDGTTGSGSLKDGNAHKFLQNGMMYILQNGMLYDAQGKRVQ